MDLDTSREAPSSKTHQQPLSAVGIAEVRTSVRRVKRGLFMRQKRPVDTGIPERDVLGGSR